jgi:hypothetical protein
VSDARAAQLLLAAEECRRTGLDTMRRATREPVLLWLTGRHRAKSTLGISEMTARLDRRFRVLGPGPIRAVPMGR